MCSDPSLKSPQAEYGQYVRNPTTHPTEITDIYNPLIFWSHSEGKLNPGVHSDFSSGQSEVDGCSRLKSTEHRAAMG